jgi:hypothetical protein
MPQAALTLFPLPQGSDSFTRLERYAIRPETGYEQPLGCRKPDFSCRALFLYDLKPYHTSHSWKRSMTFQLPDFVKEKAATRLQVSKNHLRTIWLKEKGCPKAAKGFWWFIYQPLGGAMRSQGWLFSL